jgi:intracellular multiplication protein IcmB
MANFMVSILDSVDIFLAWLSTALKQTTQSYCDLQTADSPTTLVGHDGALISVLKLHGVRALIGAEEFDRVQAGLQQSLQTTMSRPGHTIQFFFNYNKDDIKQEITEILAPAAQTAKRIGMALEDLFHERIDYLAKYCAQEAVYIVMWTRPNALTSEQLKRANKERFKFAKDKKIPAFKYTQNLLAAIPDLREAHDSFVRGLLNDMNMLELTTELLEVHDALYVMRTTVDPDFTDKAWRPSLPGDKITIKDSDMIQGEISDILWPALSRQLMPRDGDNIDLRTARVGDRIYASVFIDLFPKEIQTFLALFSRVTQTHIPWRISFLLDSGGLESTRLKAALSSVLSFTSAENRLLNDSLNLLKYININTDDAVVKLRVTVTTWASYDNMRLLRSRAAQLAKAVESWGSCDVSEVCGDAFAGVVSSMLGISGTSVATASIAPISQVLYMLPLFRPSSPWAKGALLFRSPDGKPWPYQPGSSQQTTWIDIVYARPGSGKSVLSNATNLALALSGGLQRLPRIAVIDIGPSSSGLISLLKEALPIEQRHLVAYHRLRMSPNYAINLFDTQLGCRYPTPQERNFLVNFLTLLGTPVGSTKAYDGISDMAGLVVDELYKDLADDGNPHIYTVGMEEFIDGVLEEIGFVRDTHTTWWEVTDAMFIAGFAHEAMLAQRHAMPVLGDVTTICRSSVVDDLYGKIIAPTGEPIINAFVRMISSAIREYPIISQTTKFDIGDARIVSLDLDEVAKSGGDAANRQTSVMYMLARYVLARHYFLTEDNVNDMPETYRNYHETRISEIREDPKRIVLDEFHRTAGVQAVRTQIIQDMREGRKWSVQIALISQSLEDFDPVMVEFATSVFIMDAGPEQAIQKTTQVFGLSSTAQNALRTRVHGPREGGATFLAQFATKNGMNTQLLTLTLGPVELWAFSTTAEDAQLRNKLYKRLSPAEARRVLANLFPGGSAAKVIENRLLTVKDEGGLIDEDVKLGVIDSLLAQILKEYAKNPDVKYLS